MQAAQVPAAVAQRCPHPQVTKRLCHCTSGRTVLPEQGRTLALDDRAELALFRRKTYFSNTAGTVKQSLTLPGQNFEASNLKYF